MNLYNGKDDNLNYNYKYTDAINNLYNSDTNNDILKTMRRHFYGKKNNLKIKNEKYISSKDDCTISESDEFNFKNGITQLVVNVIIY